MRPSPLASPAGLDRAAAWLAVDGEIPAGSEALARDLSIMLAFDYLIGNWDRFSGGNVTTDPTEQRLFMRDHNIAFHSPLTTARYSRLRALLERVQRFSRGFVARLLTLEEPQLRAALSEDPESTLRSVLTPAQIEAVLSRRRALLSYVGARIATDGARRTLAFD